MVEQKPDMPRPIRAKCALLIVNWNAWDELSRCIAALSRQTYKDFRVFVADNASEGAAPEGIFSKFSDLVYMRNEINCGFAEANNKLLDRVGDIEWVVFLNPDAFPESCWLEQLMSAADHNPDCSCFCSRLLMAGSPDVIDGEGDRYHISGLAWREGHGRRVRHKKKSRQVFSACAAAAMYRREILQKVGGFDEDFFCYFEDVDLGFRWRLAGYRCLLVPLAVVHHMGSATSGGQHSDFSVYYGHRNLVWTYFKNMPGLLFWLFLPYHFLLSVFSIIWFSARGQGRVILRAKKDAIKAIPLMWRKRIKIQANRSVSFRDLLGVMDKGLLPVHVLERIFEMTRRPTSSDKA